MHVARILVKESSCVIPSGGSTGCCNKRIDVDLDFVGVGVLEWVDEESIGLFFDIPWCGIKRDVSLLQDEALLSL